MNTVHAPYVLDASQLADEYAGNARILFRQADGLTHADSLLQPPFRGNCLNWVLGHIAVHRDYVLEAMGQEKILGEGPVPRYDFGSAPILEDGPDVLPLETILAAIARQQERIAETLATITPEHLASEAPKSEPRTVAQMAAFLYWHETYHVGQTELLRQLAGMDDAII
ncbi:MAG: DinB family protein [Thermomicrobiales bacterium]